ncbi:MAG: MMPL family transporter [Flavobacteriales bacterium]|nr:MMPL family transporter [Flavobacteriales bacterium]
MAQHALNVEYSVERAKILPSSHQVYLDNQDFQEKYGNNQVMAIAIQDAEFFNIDHFTNWDSLCNEITQLDGVENIVSVNVLSKLEKNNEDKRFEISSWFPDTISSQLQLDSLVQELNKQRFYDGFFNEDNDGALVLVDLNSSIVMSKKRDNLVFSIKRIVDSYADKYDVDVHYSGLPFMRSVQSVSLKKEIVLFIFLTLFITSLILYLFFRSFKAMFVSIIVVVLGVIWAFGFIEIVDYKITLLTALVPPVLIVIGIPNCIFLINKFHNEYRKNNDKIKSLKIMISKIGNITLLTNVTTATGFAAFILTNSQSLQEFGLVASLNIMVIYILSLILIPVFFSFFNPPKPTHTKHLDRRWVVYIVNYLSYLVKDRRRLIYVVTILTVVLSLFGLTKVNLTGNLSDDFNKRDVLYKDLKYFENKYGGVLPLEILINTNKKNGLFKSYNLKKIEELSGLLKTYPDFSKPSSYIDFIKYTKQVYYNNNPEYYNLPNNQEQIFLTNYISNTHSSINMRDMLIDSLNQEARMSLRIRDLSATEMDDIMSDLEPKISSIFDPDKYNVIITGTTKVLLTGTKFLLKNLVISLLLVIVLISVFMAWMFSSYRMVLISLVPNLIPLLVTGAIMGLFGIALKPSTILVFSIAFGISVDDTIHFLAKYRQELMLNKGLIKESVFSALQETGVSMLYTSVVLFFGFLIFITSDFGGTVALGFLVSVTLLIAMLTNLLLLPALLLTYEKVLERKNINKNIQL